MPDFLCCFCIKGMQNLRTEINRIQEFDKLRLAFLLLLTVSFFSLLKNFLLFVELFKPHPLFYESFFKKYSFKRLLSIYSYNTILSVFPLCNTSLTLCYTQEFASPTLPSLYCPFNQTLDKLMGMLVIRIKS